MLHKEIPVTIGYVPPLAPDFIPFYAFMREYLKAAEKRLAIAVERSGGHISVYETHFHGTPDMAETDYKYIERLARFLMWARGGFCITLYGDGIEPLAQRLKKDYSPDGRRMSDANFFATVYEQPFEISWASYDERPKAKESPIPSGLHFNGCRIGFDAGGSDRKVSAVIDGETIFSEEVVWHPKLNADPEYHYDGIVSAFKTAASKMPRVDAIGVSTAGVVINNQIVAASLFCKIPTPYPEKVKNVYLRAAQELGDVPIAVANDGDVSALAGSMSLEQNRVLGIAMGTSEAAGYVDSNGDFTGWLNELAFAPVDLSDQAAYEETVFDIGLGCKYFSQNAVIRLAEKIGIELKESDTLAEKLKTVQELMEKGDSRADKVFESIGCFLGHTTPLYAHMYDIGHMLILGRVASGKGGDRIVQVCNEILETEYPDVAASLRVVLPNEQFRRVGQSMAAASLPELMFNEVKTLINESGE